MTAETLCRDHAADPCARCDSAPAPYYEDEWVRLYHGDCREILPALDLGPVDLCLTDPPYGETSLPWDRWPEGWLQAVADAGAASLWCFGSLRMFLTHAGEFADAGWRLSQDVVWKKPRGGVAYRDRATARVHELVAHWYRGDWSAVYVDQQRVDHHGPGKGTIHRGETGPAWNGARRAHQWTDDGTRALPSVIECQTMRMRGIHPTEKPTGLLEPLLTYGCPPGGLVLDVCAGSGSTGATAKALGRRAVLIEADEANCEAAAKRLGQDTLFGGEPA